MKFRGLLHVQMDPSKLRKARALEEASQAWTLDGAENHTDCQPASRDQRRLAFILKTPRPPLAIVVIGTSIKRLGG